MQAVLEVGHGDQIVRISCVDLSVADLYADAALALGYEHVAAHEVITLIRSDKEITLADLILGYLISYKNGALKVNGQ